MTIDVPAREAYIHQMIQNGYFNYPCSTQVDVPMALRAVEAALQADLCRFADLPGGTDGED